MPLRLTPRDLNLLEDVGQAVVVQGATLQRRHFADDTSGKSCIRRLGLLTKAGLLRPFDHPLSAGKGGAPPRVYCLSDEALGILATHDRQLPLVSVGKPPSPLLMTHRLLVGRCILAARSNLAAWPNLAARWLLEQQTVPGLAMDASHEQRFILHTPLETPQGAVRLRPDAATWLTIPPAGGQPAAELVFYWEADTGGDKPSQITDKLVGYASLANQAAYRKHWPELTAARVRVLFACSTVERRAVLLRHLTPHLADQSLYRQFRVACIDDLERHGPLSAAVWHVPKQPPVPPVALLQQPAA